MGNNNELLVKVKLVSDNTNPNPSPVAGMGGTGMVVGGIPGTTGGANSTGGANPLAQNAQKAAEGLGQFNQHIGKASEAMQQLRESSKGMLSALKMALFTGGGDSQASPGHLQALMGGAKQFLGKYGMPMAVGGTALGGAGLIMGGVNAADNFMVSRGAKPWLGHGSWDRDASGRLYDWSPTRLANQAEVSMIGGGRINNRGDIRTWDQFKETEDNKFAEAMRRTSMQSPAQTIEAEQRFRMADITLDQQSFFNKHQSHQSYARDTAEGSAAYRKRMAPLQLSSGLHLQQLYGPNIAKLMSEQEGLGVRVASGGYGQQIAEARAAQDENKWNMQDTQNAIWDEEKKLREIRKGRAAGDAHMAPEDEQKSLNQIAQLTTKLRDLDKERLSIKERVTSLTKRELENAAKQKTEQELGNILQSRLGEAQTLQGQKESFGMMDVGDQQYIKDIASRFKDGGIEAITAEERSILQNSPLGEDVRIQARKRGDDAGFADIYRGSRAEARATNLESRQQELERIQVELTKTINVTAQLDKTEIAKEVVSSLGKLMSGLSVAIDNEANLRLKGADNNARLQGLQKSQAAP